MTEPSPLQALREIPRDLAALLARNAAAEVETEAEAQARAGAARTAYQEARQAIVARYEAEKAAIEREGTETRQAIGLRFEAEQTATQRAFTDARDGFEARYEADAAKAEKARADAAWTLTTMYEAKRREVEAPFQEINNQLADGALRGDALRNEARQLLTRWRHAGRFLDAAPPAGALGAPVDALRDLRKALTTAEQRMRQLSSLRVARCFEGKRFLLYFLLSWLALTGVLFGLTHYEIIAPRLHPVIVGTGASLLLATALRGMLYAIGHAQAVRGYQLLAKALSDAEAAAIRARAFSGETHRLRLIELAKEEQARDAQLRQLKEKQRILMTARDRQRDAEKQQCEEKYPRLLAAQVQQRDKQLLQAEERQRRRWAGNKQRAETELRVVESRYRQEAEQSQQRRVESIQGLAGEWQEGVAAANAAIASVQREVAIRFPSWEDWTPPRSTPPYLRFGAFEVTRESLSPESADETRERLPDLPAFTLPALTPFPERGSILLRARDDGRGAAVDALQMLMLRFLTALPPGKVRFTVIDPVGLGENFAAFMRLADHDEALIGGRIWTEARHIEQRLADLAAHMENVIQKCLRNQYRSIEEYNAQAGEVAEPFRVLVVANFPTNFTEESARRLLSIAASGAGCGVYTLVSADTRQPMPEGFRLADLEPTSVTLAWKEQRFVWKDDDLGRFPLTLDAPLTGEPLNRLLDTVGRAAKDSNRVEVSFDFIAPPPGDYWTHDSREGIDVPLGRAGATKRQHLRLGKGTAQHVLIAGKTGSGKSTLLHALITNVALHYSPDEVELYLVDFKKGVEFKAYANAQLPHARVIAVESEREFGLSVLQRLDGELRQRGDRFRSLGVHDLKGYREASGQPCPRILLIVDEFQEFFVEDDKLSQEAALLLDRLVRQGRAFGLHILLGSQTLGGAYTLARSTIDQMAVRIALQCSEADANLILSKDNAAARLLSRPGEAIYNDQNGLLEGNDIFQVVWLPDGRREELLHQLKAMDAVARPQLVFEGNVPADARANALLARALREPEWPVTIPAASAWLGEAIAIKEPTAAVFRRQTASNLLLIGQHDEAAVGILAAALVSLASQHAPTGDSATGARFRVLDGQAADSPFAGLLGKVLDCLPHDTQLGGWREVPAFLTEIAAEVERRQKTTDGDFPAIYLVVHGLHRLRDLRKADDDYGFSRRADDAPVPPAKQLETILKEGAAVGVHCLIWCDGLNNVHRTLDRQTLREFESRVLFQMSPNDSSTLIDSPAASKLGMNRALFHSEDQALPEKFRPYALPVDAWLAEVADALTAKRMMERAAMAP